MAMTTDLLEALVDTGFGPLSVSKTADPLRYEASIDGDRVGIIIDGPAIRLVASSPARWPSGPSDQVDSRVRFALDGLLLGRADLAEFDAAEDQKEITARLWLDGATTTAGTLAAAVQATRLLARAGATMLDSVEEEMRAEEAWIASRPAPVPLPDVPAAPAVDTEVAQPVSSHKKAKAPAPPTVERAAAAPAPPKSPVAQPEWVFVEQPTPMYGLENTDAVIGSAEPAQWYQLEREDSGWAHLTDPASGLSGWVDAQAVRRQGS
ncbi:MAG: hypothetical protein GY720_03735 [bacterium]|nr:hypothetical protein [bacterium]